MLSRHSVPFAVRASSSRIDRSSEVLGDKPVRGARVESRSVRYDDLPGAELVLPGIEDLRHGVESVPALLASELGDAAHSRYNALLRRLLSFAHAAACAN